MAAPAEFTTKYIELITKNQMDNVLKADVGTGAQFVSYRVMANLAAEGSRFGSRTLRIIVEYIDSGDNLEATYIVKLYSAPECILRTVYEKLFKAETDFYKITLPQMNDVLKKANELPLHTPEYLSSSLYEGSAVIYFKDLAEHDYRCREVPFDEAHTKLVIEELARFHAASMLLLSSEGATCDNVGDKFPSVRNCIPDLEQFLRNYDINMVESSFKTGIAICDKLDEHTYVSEYLRSIKDVDQTWEAMIKPTDQFMAIRHGNLKSNNVMFR